jgi:hypothetical protein
MLFATHTDLDRARAQREIQHNRAHLYTGLVGRKAGWR